MRSTGRTTGVRRRTGSGTTAQTSGCVSSSSGTRSTVAASATLAALGQARLDQRARIGQPRDAAAIAALAAKIVAQPLAIGRLREHARQRVLADAARPGKQHGVRHAIVRQHAAQRGDDFRVAEKFREGHGRSLA